MRSLEKARLCLGEPARRRTFETGETAKPPRRCSTWNIYEHAELVTISICDYPPVSGDRLRGPRRRLRQRRSRHRLVGSPAWRRTAHFRSAKRVPTWRNAGSRSAPKARPARNGESLVGNLCPREAPMVQKPGILRSELTCLVCQFGLSGLCAGVTGGGGRCTGRSVLAPRHRRDRCSRAEACPPREYPFCDDPRTTGDQTCQSGGKIVTRCCEVLSSQLAAPPASALPATSLPSLSRRSLSTCTAICRTLWQMA